uniref:Uncharacterized protein n=1 Tax=Anguilla anguilla TaxID=7936 RepID=A0A0E9S2L3_ANGAN
MNDFCHGTGKPQFLCHEHSLRSMAGGIYSPVRVPFV